MNKKNLFTLIYSFVALICLELVFKLSTVGYIDTRFIYTLLFCIPSAGILFIISSLFYKTVNKYVYNVLIFLITVYFCVQCVYYKIFGSFMSVYSLKMGGDAINNFTEQLKIGISDSALDLVILLLIPLISVLLTLTGIIGFDRIKIRFSLVTLGAVVLAHFASVLLLTAGGTGVYTVYDAYHSEDTSTDSSVKNLGILITTRLETQHLFLNLFKVEKEYSSNSMIHDLKEYSNDEYNVSTIDFNEILGKCKTKEAADLTVELAKREPTKKNEYTGIFKGYNLITVCAESFSPYLISEDMTPTLYRLANEGFVFNNFYASFDSVTTNGEYAYCLGMFPDMSRSKADNSFIASSENALPYALGNMFRSNDAKTYAYHNFLGTYYSRNVTHPNMGYSVFKTPTNGLDIAPTWPSSDYEMMVQSVEDYVNSGRQFHAYYMTFSGHCSYNWSNIMCVRNRSQTEDLQYPKAVKAYISSNLELEKAMAYLVKRLEEERIADKTVIVITTDHYPYGLTDYEYKRMAGIENMDSFDRYKNSFICWTAGMEESVIVDDICSSIDILPTLLNLFGFDYDSRLVMGRDVLSDSEELAILSNQSYITPDYKFDATDNTLTMITDNSIESENIEETKKYIKDIFALSRAILNTNFYQYIGG